MIRTLFVIREDKNNYYVRIECKKNKITCMIKNGNSNNKFNLWGELPTV